MSKNKKIIIGSAIAVIAIIITTLVVCINVSLSQRCGYHDILDQLENGTYVNPTSGDYIVNDAGWIIKIQQVENAENPIKYLAKADKKDNIGLFVGYKVDIEAKNITYAFIAIEDNGAKYTVFSTQQIDKSFTFEKTDYSEIDKVFGEDTKDIENSLNVETNSDVEISNVESSDNESSINTGE